MPNVFERVINEMMDENIHHALVDFLILKKDRGIVEFKFSELEDHLEEFNVSDVMLQDILRQNEIVHSFDEENITLKTPETFFSNEEDNEEKVADLAQKATNDKTEDL